MPLRFFTETRTGEIQSRLANDVGGVQSVVTDTASSVTSNLATSISTIIAMFIIDWRLTALSLGLTPFFLYLTYRVGKVRREVSSETQKSLAEMSAMTEETLSVSGILLSKTFGQQDNAVRRFRGINAVLAGLQIRQAMVGRWFFMIIGTIFSITPAFVYWLAGYQRRPVGADHRRHRRLHDAPEPALLPARSAAQRAGRDPGRPGPVRPDLRVS
jgi:ATP-binding cassette subfamily B protein